MALRAYLDEFDLGPLTLIFGAMRDKNLNEMATALFSRADLLILTVPENERAASLETLLEIAKETTDCRIVSERSSEAALRLAREQTPSDGMICVTGSLYLVGEVRARLYQA
jgi:dihydrofolate synthase/folylpolyglutamate synthase